MDLGVLWTATMQKALGKIWCFSLFVKSDIPPVTRSRGVLLHKSSGPRVASRHKNALRNSRTRPCHAGLDQVLHGET